MNNPFNLNGNIHQMSRRFVVPNLASLCTTYRSSLQFAVRNNDEIRRHIKDKYVSVKPSIILSLTGLVSDRRMWYDTLLKMDPVAYHNRKEIYSHGLLIKHEGQIVFANKVLPMVEKLDFENERVMNQMLSNYALFLDLCLTNQNVKDMRDARNAKTVQIVPTLIEDFVWHSHMLDHKDYVDMTTKMFGKILGHRTDLDMEKADRESRIVRKKYLKSKGLIQNDSMMGSTNSGNMIGMAGMVGMGAMGAIAYNNSSSSNHQTPIEQRKDERPSDKPDAQKDSGSIDSSGCSADLMGFGPTGIYNPINPWNSVNPISPYYHSHHNSHGHIGYNSDSLSSYSSNDSSNDSSSSDSSSCSSSSCSGGGCGGD